MKQRWSQFYCYRPLEAAMTPGQAAQVSMPDEISPEFRFKIPHPRFSLQLNRNFLARFVYRRRSVSG